MSIGIIGGGGFIGRRFASVLNEAKISNQVFDKKFEGDRYVDVTNPETFNALPQLSCVVNLAAEHRDNVKDKALYDLVNVDGSRNVCNFCRKRNINTIVFTSSVAVYGFAPEGIDESGEIDYFNDYGRTKYLAENIYREWYEEDSENRNLIIVRPTVVFGEGNRGNVYNLFSQIAAGRFVLIGNGNNRKSLAYVQNVAEFLKYVTLLKGYHLYNYIDKPDLDMNTLVAMARKSLVQKTDVGPRIPAWLGMMVAYIFDLASFALRKEFAISSIRVKKFMRSTSFDSSISDREFKASVSLREGLEKTLNYEFKGVKDRD